MCIFYPINWRQAFETALHIHSHVTPTHQYVLIVTLPRSRFRSREVPSIIIAVISRWRGQTVHVLLDPGELLVGHVLPPLHPDGAVYAVLGDPVVRVLDSLLTWRAARGPQRLLDRALARPHHHAIAGLLEATGLGLTSLVEAGARVNSHRPTISNTAVNFT